MPWRFPCKICIEAVSHCLIFLMLRSAVLRICLPPFRRELRRLFRLGHSRMTFRQDQDPLDGPDGSKTVDGVGKAEDLHHP